MRLGLIARADPRGVGIQTHEVWRNMRPERTLVIDPGDLSPYRMSMRYPDATIVAWDGGWYDWIDRHLLTDFLAGLDAVFTVETPYDFRLYDQARKMGVATILHANPEFFRHSIEPDLPRPTEVWAPSEWRLDEMRASGLPVRSMPMPISTDRFTPRLRTEPVEEFLHIVGHKAARDRNGTVALFQALRRVRKPITVWVRSQSRLPRMSSGRIVRRRAIVDNLEDFTALYSHGDALLLPRAYGGLCLPVNEAMAAGMPVIGSDRIPEQGWLHPEALVETREARPPMNTQGGPIEVVKAEPTRLVEKIHRLASDADYVRALSEHSIQRARDLSWDRQRSVWTAAFAEAAERARASTPHRA